MSAQNIR